MKKKISALAIGLATLVAAASCGKSDGKTPGGVNGGSAKGTLTVRLFDGGYGHQFLDDIARAYESVNKGTKIVIKTTVDTSSDMTKMESGLYIADLFISTTTLGAQGRKGTFMELDDVFASTPTGESKTVAEKLGDSAEMFKSFNGHYYGFPVNDGMTGLVYNKTTLDEAFGEGNWKEPRTSDELYNLCKRLVQLDKGYYPFVYTTDTNAEYQWWMTYAYLAQLLGEEGYYKAGFGQYFDEASNKYVFDATGETVYDLEQKKSAIKDVQRFNGAENGMASQWCDGMDFAEAQSFFLGYGYGSKDKGKAAFMTNGDWVYNEMQYLISDDNPQDIRMMNFPVTSYILDYTESIDNDEELCALISAIDMGSDALTGNGYSVSQEDYDRVKEARSMVYTLKVQMEAGIPSTSKNAALAKSFLTFFASDTAGTIYSKALHGDITPFTRNVTEVTPNTFIKSKLDTLNNINGVTYIYSATDAEKFNVGFYGGLYYYSRLLHEGTALNEYLGDYKKTFLARYSAAKVTAGIMG